MSGRQWDRRFVWSLLVAAALFAGAATVAAAVDIIDQANVPGIPSVGWFIQYGASLGQEFVPELNEIAFAELFVENPANEAMGEVQIEILLDSLEGPSLGSSTIVEVPPNYYGLIRCDFLPAVPVAPGERHVLHVHSPWGTAVYVFTTTFDQYPLGRLFVWGDPYDSEDLWFREGVVATGLAEPSGTWGVIKALYQ